MGKKKGTNISSVSQDYLLVDPIRVRFQHSKIRTHFSGCGRSVVQTLDDIREGKLKPEGLPPIQVLVGPMDEDGKPWYFSLNNRRLWVLKRCREEGLLTNNHIPVRVRKPKSASEIERYTLQNCALEAKFIGSNLITKVGDLDNWSGSISALLDNLSNTRVSTQGDVESKDTKKTVNETARALN